MLKKRSKGARFHYIEAHVLDRFLRLVGLPRVELVEDRDGLDPYERARVSLGDVDLRQADPGDRRRAFLVIWACAHEAV